MQKGLRLFVGFTMAATVLFVAWMFRIPPDRPVVTSDPLKLSLSGNTLVSLADSLQQLKAAAQKNNKEVKQVLVQAGIPGRETYQLVHITENDGGVLVFVEPIPWFHKSVWRIEWERRGEKLVPHLSREITPYCPFVIFLVLLGWVWHRTPSIAAWFDS